MRTALETIKTDASAFVMCVKIGERKTQMSRGFFETKSSHQNAKNTKNPFNPPLGTGK